MASFFEDTFEVKNIDPEGKLFEKGMLSPSQSVVQCAILNLSKSISFEIGLQQCVVRYAAAAGH